MRHHCCNVSSWIVKARAVGRVLRKVETKPDTVGIKSPSSSLPAHTQPIQQQHTNTRPSPKHPHTESDSANQNKKRERNDAHLAQTMQTIRPTRAQAGAPRGAARRPTRLTAVNVRAEKVSIHPLDWTSRGTIGTIDWFPSYQRLLCLRRPRSAARGPRQAPPDHEPGRLHRQGPEAGDGTQREPACKQRGDRQQREGDFCGGWKEESLLPFHMHAHGTRTPLAEAAARCSWAARARVRRSTSHARRAEEAHPFPCSPFRCPAAAVAVARSPPLASPSLTPASPRRSPL